MTTVDEIANSVAEAVAALPGRSSPLDPLRVTGEELRKIVVEKVDPLADAFAYLVSVAREVKGQNTREFMDYLQEQIREAMELLNLRANADTEPARLRRIMEGAYSD